MSGEAELPSRPEPRGVAGWLRFGAVVLGALAPWILVVLFLLGPLDALGKAWGLPHRISLGKVVAGAAWGMWLACCIGEWTRPSRRFLSAHGLPTPKSSRAKRSPR